MGPDAAWAAWCWSWSTWLGQWRDVAGSTAAAAGALRHAVDRQHRSCRSASSWRSTTSASRQNKRWDLTANQVFSLSDQTVKILQDLDAPVSSRSSTTRSTSIGSAIGSTSTLSLDATSVDYVDVDREPARANAGADRGLRHGRDRPTRAAPSASPLDEQDDHQRAHQGGDRPGEEGLLHAGPRRAGHASIDRAGYSSIASGR